MNKNLIIVIVLILILAGVSYWYAGQNKVKDTEIQEPTGEMVGEVVEGGEANNVTNGGALALSSNTWVWQETQMNDGTVVKPKKVDAFTITFTKEGRANGTTDCNSFFTDFKLNGDIIMWGTMGSTLMFCADSQETEFLNMLQNANGFLFHQQGNLVLTLKFDSGSMLFKKK